jgi:hypothetical protein
MRKIIVGARISMDSIVQAPSGPAEDVDKAFKFGGWARPFQDQDSKVSSTTSVARRSASLRRALSAVSPQTRPWASPSSHSAPGPFWRWPAAMRPSVRTSSPGSRRGSSPGPGSGSKCAGCSTSCRGCASVA